MTEPSNPSLTAAVIIVSRNRCRELIRAVQSALQQKSLSELLILLDGTSDDSFRVLKDMFSEEHRLQIYPFNESKGCIYRRNQAATLSSANIIFSLDDDATFSSPETVHQTIRDFIHPNIAAVAIPFVEPEIASSPRQTPPDNEKIYLTDSFIGTAYAVRRDIFLLLGGFRTHLIHQGEESDFCLRLYAAGYVVRLGTAPPIQHFPSPIRSLERMDYYGVRNTLLFHWQNTPTVYLIPALIHAIARCLLHTLKPKRLLTRMRGLFDALIIIPKIERRPVSTKLFKIWRKLRTLGSIATDHIILKPLFSPHKSSDYARRS
ncbi:MAG: glycosyltransferase family 2 protein [Methylacidiphilales bacterium]|nr:glycosyltransferase family 2 protein [Candidatus Methylacidiphilales bacterium]MDW8349554.1 glycosyltransferase family A protein [Verrucomicrobiae bacterium]